MNQPTSILHPEDRELLSGLLLTGPERRKSEELLFQRYHYFIQDGRKKYKLREDESLDAYCDAVLSFMNEISKGNFEGRATVKTYLYKIFSNKCVDLVRKNTTNKSSIHQTESISDILFQVSDAGRSALQRLIDKADRAKLKEKLLLLGENCRKMLLFWADGYSDKEISAALEYKSADVVKTSRLRCLEKLRELYKTN